MPVKVSVVVPVYNPGPHIDDLIASLLRQSLPPDEFEVIFVDDGSTDGTGERLDALVTEHPNFKVLHIPNSGWPGRPRNVGTDAAAGKYVYYVDNDDWIGDEALERLYSTAERNGADIVIGKMAGHGRPVPFELFHASQDCVTLEDFPPLLGGERARGDPLTPHKLFRKAFLEEHGIRFAEGPRRLEDHLFVVNAYFRARVISVLADYVCYHFARRDANASRGRFDPRGYYDNLREVLDVVEEHTEPGPFRDRLLRHWYKQKLLARAGGRALVGYPPEYRRALVTEMRRLALERFGPGVLQGLPTNFRVRSALLRAGEFDLLTALARVESGLQAAVRLDDVRWDAGELVLGVSGQLMYGDGTPLAFDRQDEKLYWTLPVDLGSHVTPEDRDVSTDVATSRIDVAVRSRDDHAEFLLAGTSRVVCDEKAESATVSVIAEARLDPATSAAGSAIARGTWDLLVRIHTGGWVASARLGSGRSKAVPERLPAALVGEPLRCVIPFWTVERNLSVDVDHARKSLASLVNVDDASVRRERSAVALAVAVPVRLESPASVVPVQLHAKRIGSTVRTVTVPATVSAHGVDGSSTLLEAFLPFRKILPTRRFISPGSWKLAATIGVSSKSLGLVLDVSAREGGSVRSAPAEGDSPADAVVPPPLAERVLFNPSWRQRVPAPIRVGARAVLDRTERLAASALVPRKR